MWGSQVTTTWTPGSRFKHALDVSEVVEVAFDAKIKTPVVVHPCLPDVLGLIIFLDTERRMTEVPQEIAKLFAKLPLHALGCCLK